jgi:tRNA modification GTPase
MDTTRRVPDISETIVALSSAPGAAARAIVRLSGPDSLRLAAQIFQTTSHGFPSRGFYKGELQLPGLRALLPALAHVSPGPRSYTGQDLFEFHLLGSPPLVDCLIQCLLGLGARTALPGEFTMRAVLAGKIDLTQAEAVLGVLQATHRDELRSALGQLAGGVLGPMRQLREDLLCLLADLEAGLDFADEDIQFIDEHDLSRRLSAACEQVAGLLRQLEKRAVYARPFRVVLVGPPNAGKSSLFNALLKKDAALTSPTAGTTRDYLSEICRRGDVDFEFIDTAGTQSAETSIEHQAQDLRARQGDLADLLLLCAANGAFASLERAQAPAHLHVSTKCDVAVGPPGTVSTSALTGAGIDGLWLRLEAEAHKKVRPTSEAHAARSVHHLGKTLGHLHEAKKSVMQREPELVALELRGALAELGELTGAVFTDDLLDRIFSRFCIGK